MSEQKIQIAIYKIDEDAQLFTDTESIITALSDHIVSKDFEKQNLVANTRQGYEMALFYKKNPMNPKWKDFLNEVVSDGQNILKDRQSWGESFVLLLFNNSSGNLYAATGGMGYHVVQDFIDDDFGVDILARLMTKDDKILRSVKEKNVIGGVLGTTKFFRKNYNLFENDGFGKIYQELTSSLNKGILRDRFGFSEEELKNDSNCIAKTSFKISKSISIDQLLQIINGCESIYDDENLTPISINNVEKVVKKKNVELINALEGVLLDQLWQTFNENDGSYQFDICHKDFEKYLTASKYIFKKNYSEANFFGETVFENLRDINELFDILHVSERRPEDKESFVDLVKSLKVYTYNEETEEQPLTKGWLLHHLFGDVSLEDDKYFLIDNNWYKIKPSFISELNESCNSFITSNYDNGLEQSWDFANNENENAYNAKFISENPLNDRVVVLDKITPENIEPCDILKWDDSNLYFYHVKAGFGNTLRDLCSQVFIAASELQSDVNSSQEYIGKIYDHLLSKRNSEDEYFASAFSQTINMTKDQFVGLFGNKKMVFVLAVLDTATNERTINDDISVFGSNIAKFSLQELVKGMRGLGIEFRITQITRQG